MENKLTVAELIEILRKMPQGIEVEMAMNMEYQNGVTADMVEVQEYDGRRYLCITDTPDCDIVDDTEYNADGSIRAKYLADDGEIRYEDTNEIATA
jgi:hypothetical protein